MRQNEDMLSVLPKMILHDILSRLPEKDAARTSVLSKAWADTWSTFPILSFCDTMKNKKNFIDYVNRSLRKFSDQGLAIKQFKLSMNYFKPHYMSENIVDLWLKLACESGVEVIELSMWNRVDQCYMLPTRFIEVKLITKLVLEGEIKVDHAFINRSIKFISLRVLSLRLVPLEDDHTIEHLISCSPLIEDITLEHCFVLRSKTERTLKSLTLRGVQNLKATDIGGINDIYIEAPTLENLCYSGPGDNYLPIRMDFYRCINLRRMDLSWSRSKCSIITSKWFLELFRNVPFLESLILDNYSMSATINISSDQLKMLKLSNSVNRMEEVNIDAPNLLSCLYYDYVCHSKPIISFLRSSSQLEINVYLSFRYLDILHNVQELIQNCIKPHKFLTSLSLYLRIARQRVVHVEKPTSLQVLSPLQRIKHLYLCYVPENESSIWSIVNILFINACSETISLKSDYFDGTRDFLKFFYKTLKVKKEDNCFCSSSHTKCWWHGLKDVKILCSIKVDENVDFETMLESLPTRAINEYISFTL